MVHHVEVQPVGTRDVPIHTRPARVIVPTEQARRLVVSDIDDTIMRSDATDTAQLVRNTVTGSSWTRQAFEGTDELFAGLQRGPGLDEHNPVAYLSSSAWNLYDFLVGFLRRSAMPLGPLFLRDLGIDRQRFIKSSHSSHKRARIDELLDAHDLPLVLVGDTGQHDAEIYRGVVGDNPDRVELVLLRDVADARRAADVRELFADTDVPVTVAPTSTAFAATCEELGLVGPGWTDRVATEL
jgi:phosphatidate phosphatase APP1